MSQKTVSLIELGHEASDKTLYKIYKFIGNSYGRAVLLQYFGDLLSDQYFTPEPLEDDLQTKAQTELLQRYKDIDSMRSELLCVSKRTLEMIKEIIKLDLDKKD